MHFGKAAALWGMAVAKPWEGGQAGVVFLQAGARQCAGLGGGG